MSDQWPDPHQRPGGYEPPPGYQSGAQQSYPYGDPGGQQAYGAPPPYGYPGAYGMPYPDPAIETMRGSMIGALITSVVTLLLCGLLTNVLGLVFSIVAMAEKYDAEKARRFTKYAWVSNWVHIGIVAVLVVGLFAFWLLIMIGVASSSSY